MKQYWILKSEPDTFSMDDLVTQKKSFWDGVRNYQARNFIKSMQAGEEAFFYHSSCKQIGIAGKIKISTMPEFDPTQFDVKSQYYDLRAKPEAPLWWGVWVVPVKKYSSIFSLESLKSVTEFKNHPITRKGNRLSVLPIELKQFVAIDKILGP